MRPVNLLPEGSVPRSGGISLPGGGNALGYVVLGVLAAVLVAVLAMVHFSNQIGEKEEQVAALQATEAETQARAASLAQFTNFQTVRESRQQTITSLAQSRFDWERVMRELSLVLPERVWLTNLTGTVAPDVTVEKAGAVALRSSVTGPALQLVGCARSQRDVARLIAALEDLDGVTRVTVEGSAKPESTVAESAESAEANVAEDCRTRDFITQFHAVAAFDAVAVPDGAVPTTPLTPPATTSEAPATEPTTTTASAEAPSEPATAQPTEAEGVAEAEDEAGQALSAIGSGENGKQR